MAVRILVFTFALVLGCGWAQPPATTDWSKSPLADKIRNLCPEIDGGQLKYGWPLPQVASQVAMDRCFAISSGSPGKRLTADQIRAWADCGTAGAGRIGGDGEVAESASSWATGVALDGED